MQIRINRMHSNAISLFEWKGLNLYVSEIDKFQCLVSNVYIFEWKFACLDGFCCIDNIRNVNVYGLRVSQKRHMPFFFHVTREHRKIFQGRHIHAYLQIKSQYLCFLFLYIFSIFQKKWSNLSCSITSNW